MTTPPGAANGLDVSGGDGRSVPGSDPPTRPRDFAPAPRRSRVGLVAQFVLQFLYLPVWVLIAVGLVVLALWIDTAPGNANIFPPSFVFQFSSVAISWRRLRTEWHGRAEDWEPFTDALLQKRFSNQEENGGWIPAMLPPSGERRLVVDIPVRHYRGLSGLQLERLAHRRGWSVDWHASDKARTAVRFSRVMPSPEQVGVPDPYGPPPAPGTPWGPLPFRLAMPLLTFVFAPSLRGLELRRDPDAYLAHLRAHLPRRFRAESARNTVGNYTADENGRILRRVRIGTWHFRGVGAQAVLRVAAEQGWRLDHSFPANPDRALHLCRLEDLPPKLAKAARRGA